MTSNSHQTLDLRALSSFLNYTVWLKDCSLRGHPALVSHSRSRQVGQYPKGSIASDTNHFDRHDGEMDPDRSLGYCLCEVRMQRGSDLPASPSSRSDQSGSPYAPLPGSFTARFISPCHPFFSTRFDCSR